LNVKLKIVKMIMKGGHLRYFSDKDLNGSTKTTKYYPPSSNLHSFNGNLPIGVGLKIYFFCWPSSNLVLLTVNLVLIESSSKFTLTNLPCPIKDPFDTLGPVCFVSKWIFITPTPLQPISTHFNLLQTNVIRKFYFLPTSTTWSYFN